MTALLFIPSRSAARRTWSKAEVVEAWESGDDGKRLFALALISGNPSLAVAEVLVQGIRSSHSAFEQYHALRAANAARSSLNPATRQQVDAAVKAEEQGLPRDDGMGPLPDKSDRMALARLYVKRI
jgi:hypothetical protein